jgi:hypothetical protein
VTRRVEVLDPFTDGERCHICGSRRWVVVGDHGKFRLLCANGECSGRRGLPADVVVIDPGAQ